LDSEQRIIATKVIKRTEAIHPACEEDGFQVYCERSEATILLGVEPGNKQIQIYGPSDFGRLAIYVLCPRHFFVHV
jgi:hypothetical protein